MYRVITANGVTLKYTIREIVARDAVTKESIENALGYPVTVKGIGAAGSFEFKSHVHDETVHIFESERQAWDANIRKTDALLKVTQGIVWDFEEDSADGNKTVPTGAKAAGVTKAGAKSLVWNQGVLNTTGVGSGIIEGFKIKPNDRVYLSLTIDSIPESDYDFYFQITTKSHISNTSTSVILSPHITDGNAVDKVSEKRTSAVRTILDAWGELEGDAKLTPNYGTISTWANGFTAHPEVNRVGTMIVNLTTLYGEEFVSKYTDAQLKDIFESMFTAASYEATLPVLRNYEPKKVLCIGAEEFVEKTIDLSAVIEKYFPDGMKSVGDVYDEIDIENGKAIKRVGSIDLGDIPSWGLVSTTSTVSAGRYKSDHIKNTIKAPSGNATKANMICDGFETVTSGDTWYGVNGICADDTGSIFVFDGTNDVNAFKQRAAGKKLYYELSEPVITDITDTFGSDLIVEAGDRLLFEGDYPDAHVPLPNTVKYMVKLSEVS